MLLMLLLYYGADLMNVTNSTMAATNATLFYYTTVIVDTRTANIMIDLLLMLQMVY